MSSCYVLPGDPSRQANSSQLYPVEFFQRGREREKEKKKKRGRFIIRNWLRPLWRCVASPNPQNPGPSLTLQARSCSKSQKEADRPVSRPSGRVLSQQGAGHHFVLFRPSADQMGPTNCFTQSIDFYVHLIQNHPHRNTKNHV